MTVKTPNLKGRGDICLFVPKMNGPQHNLPIYLLLHGVYGSAWVWPMKAGAHMIAKHLMDEREIQPAIVAFPSDGLWGDGSAYYSHHGKNFEQWIVSDVPLAIQENIPQASEQSALCIGGLSMGGYGALLLGGRYPEVFSAISGHSSITALKYMEGFVEESMGDYVETFEGADVFETLCKNREQLPPLRFDCGVNDDLIEPNRYLHQQLQAEGIKHTYEEYPGGHQWAYWQEQVAKTFRFFDHALSQPEGLAPA